MKELSEKLIDIIVPVFNKSSHINDLILDLSKLPCQYFNILIIDDGSTDGSDTITKKIIENMSLKNIHFFRKENGGVSSARNFGINRSKSEYIWFFDPDDRIHPDAIEYFSNNFELHADIIIFDYVKLNANNGKTVIFNFDEINCLNSRDFAEKYNYFSERNNMSYIWNKLYKRSVLEKIKFEDGVNLSEDRRFNLMVFDKNLTISFIGKYLYIYMMYGSNTLSTEINEKKINDIYSTNIINLKFLANKRDYCKKHIIDQVSLRKITKDNLWKFYSEEHEKLGINFLPFSSSKEILIFMLIRLNIYRFFFKAYKKLTKNCEF